MTKEEALHSFFSGFGIPAYEENTVPDSATLPYITYSVVTGDFYSGSVAISRSVWYRATTWTGINAKAEEISRFLGLGGKIVRCDTGGLWIKRGTPFRQNMADPDDTIRRKYLNFEVDFITE